MPNNPTIIIEIGDRYIASLSGPEAGYALRAMLKFTYKTPVLPGPKNKDAKWYGPLALKGDELIKDNKPGQWETAEAVQLLRNIADMLETGKFGSHDQTVEGDLPTVMRYELERT